MQTTRIPTDLLGPFTLPLNSAYMGLAPSTVNNLVKNNCLLVDPLPVAYLRYLLQDFKKSDEDVYEEATADKISL